MGSFLTTFCFILPDDDLCDSIFKNDIDAIKFITHLKFNGHTCIKNSTTKHIKEHVKISWCGYNKCINAN